MRGRDRGDSRDAVDGFIGEEEDEMIVYDGYVVGWWRCGKKVPRGVDGRICGIHTLLYGAGVEEFCQRWADRFQESNESVYSNCFGVVTGFALGIYSG